MKIKTKLKVRATTISESENYAILSKETHQTYPPKEHKEPSQVIRGSTRGEWENSNPKGNTEREYNPTGMWIKGAPYSKNKYE